jgi:hypothetical protein
LLGDVIRDAAFSIRDLGATGSVSDEGLEVAGSSPADRIGAMAQRILRSRWRNPGSIPGARIRAGLVQWQARVYPLAANAYFCKNSNRRSLLYKMLQYIHASNNMKHNNLQACRNAQ